MNRKSILSIGGGIVLASGLVILLVLMTAPAVSQFSLSAQKGAAIFIFFFSLFVVAPLIARRLRNLEDIRKILGWTLIGTGAEFILFPAALVFLILTFPSWGTIVIWGAILAYAAVFGIPAGIISVAAGVYLIKRKIPSALRKN